MGLLLALLVFGAWQPAHATILVSDDFPTNGTLAGRTPAVGGTWTTFSGTANEIQVVNGYVLLNDANDEDIESMFSPITSGTLFLGFDLIVNDPGAYEGTDFEYFIHFSGSTFSARADIAAFSASGFRPGIATASSTAETIWPVDLAYGSSHRIVIRFDFSTGLASLWVDPSALSDSHIISITAVPELTIDAVNLRQSPTTPNQSLRIGRLRVATTFDEARILPPSPDLSWYGDGVNAGGTGTWSSTGNQWSDNGGAPGAWDASKTAIFGTTSGTVTVDAAGIDAEAGLSFEVDGYTLTGGPLNLGTGNNPISVAASSTANLTNVLAGTVTSVQKTGLGTLTLGGENTFTGPIQINQGSLQITADGALGDEDNDLVFGGGTLTIPSDVVLGNSRALSGNALFSIDGGQSLSVSGSHNTTATKLTDTGTLNLLGSIRNVGAVEFESAGVLTGAGALVGTGLTAPLLTTGTARVLQAIDLSGSSETIDVGSGGTLNVEQSLTASNTLTKEGLGTLILGATSSISRLQIGRGGFSFTQGGTVRVNHTSQLGNNTIYHNYGTLEPAAPINTSVGIEFAGRSSTEAVIGGNGGNQALVVSGPITFYGPSGSGDMVVRINNETTFSNAVTLSTSASISGWTVRGTGQLTLSGDSSATLVAPVTLADSVRLNMTGAMDADLTLNTQTRLLGSGTIDGSVAGAGTVTPDASILTMDDFDPSAGMDVEILLSESAPDYNDTTAADNSVVRLKSSSPLLTSLDSDNEINVFFSVANLNDGDKFKGGFFTDQASDFLSQVESATYTYYLLGDGNGSDITKNGQGYYALANQAPNISIDIATEPETATFASGTINGQVMVFSVQETLPAGTKTFASYVDGFSGNVGDVGFMLSGLSSPGYGEAIQSLGMVGADWDNAGTQQGRLYSQNTAKSFTITFDSPITDLELYLYYFRGGESGGSGYDSYTFSEPFVIAAGLTGTTLTGTTLDTSAVNFANGVLSFAGPVSSLTVSATGTAIGGDAGFTLAAVVTAPGAPAIGTASSPGSGEISVLFTAPASTGGSAITAYNATCISSNGGVSGSQSGSSSPLTVTSLTNGKTYTCTVTATNTAGTGTASSASNSVVPTSGQTITFANPGAQNFGTTPSLTATATSGLTVTFTSSTTDVCTITSGGALTFVTTGTCTIDANQMGNDAYEQAPTVSRSFTVNALAPGAPTIGAASSPDSGEISVLFTAPASTGGSAITNYTASCSSSDGGVSGSQSGSSSPLTVTSLTNGKTYTCTVTATNIAGTGTASSASNSVVPTSGQTITFANPGAQNFSTTPTLSASSTSGLAVTFTSTTTDVCTITSGGALTFVTTGTCTIDANQMGNDAYEQAATVSQSFTVQDPFPSGTGTHDDPYQITNWNHLNAMRNDLDAYYQLANDLTTQTRGYETHASATANAGQGWLPLGPTLSTPFSGALDGQGHTIQGLTINNANDYTSLFGVYRPKFAADGEATIQIKNLGLLDVNISGTEYTGALIGYLETPFVSNDDTEEDISAKYATTLVQDVFVAGGTVEGTITVGGLIGFNNNRTVQRIYSNVAVTGVDAVGGLVGTSFGSISDCFALGSVQLSDTEAVPSNPRGLGGLMGYNDRTIERCYATGHVDDSESSGGLFGTAWIEPNNYWDSETTGQQSSTGTNGNPDPDAQDSGGLSSVQLKTLNQIAATWDFVNVWTITDPATGTIAYPTLRSMPVSPAPGLTTTPGTPTLIAPANGDIEVDVATALTWSDPVLADNFILELETFDGAITVFNGVIIGETEKIPSLLQGNTTYRWRVRGINTTHDSANPILGPFSDYATFTTGPRPDEIFSDRFQATDS